MSTRFVVDTNVPIVANGRSRTRKGERNASSKCRIEAIEFLEMILRRGRIILDLNGEIQQEYLQHLNPKGQPGVGDRFLQVVLNSAPRRVERVVLGKTGGEFFDFPRDPALVKFDPSDRKFAAAARNAGASVANAIDSDWLDHREALSRNGVKVKFVCGCDRAMWFEEIA